jgi:AcrR family transcriptional regulator
MPALERQQERRNLLLDAAFDLLGRDGWDAMTVRSVLERARLNPRYFYENFADLDQLAVAVYDRVVQSMGLVVMSALAESGDDPAEQVRAVLGGIVAFVDEDRRRGRVLYAEGLGNEALNRRRMDSGQAVVAFLEGYAASHLPRGRTMDTAGRVAASILVGGFSQLLVDWLAGRVAVGREELVHDATEMFLAMGDATAGLSAKRRVRKPAS